MSALEFYVRERNKSGDENKVREKKKLRGI
jgi:hypothetical protein